MEVKVTCAKAAPLWWVPLVTKVTRMKLSTTPNYKQTIHIYMESIAVGQGLLTEPALARDRHKCLMPLFFCKRIKNQIVCKKSLLNSHFQHPSTIKHCSQNGGRNVSKVKTMPPLHRLYLEQEECKDRYQTHCYSPESQVCSPLTKGKIIV